MVLAGSVSVTVVPKAARCLPMRIRIDDLMQTDVSQARVTFIHKSVVYCILYEGESVRLFEGRPI